MANELQSEKLSPIKQALYEIRTLREKVHELEGAQREPIAIIGMGLRLPGMATDAASYWKILAEGLSTITEIPASRWKIEDYYDPDPDAPGKMYTRHGSFIADEAGFDAHFFGISPREAVELDPQHRLALEVAWDALENAGCSPAQASGNKAGVFLALSNSDYGRMVFNNRINELDAYSSTGSNFSVAAGRISYTLGLQGPSIVVDTACSGSLVAVHLACQSLRARDCRMALAGGVNLILSPEINVNFSKARMLSVDGRCKTFDSKADGFVRGEGCGIVVLKRLSDALADADNILAVIRGSALNQDGRSGGLTVPNGKAQEAVIRQALANGGVKAEEIGYVEAHGTGTALGDPIEAHALAAALGPGRTRENPLVVGSVKTNLGHLESAAGVAGLIKVVLSLQHEQIPAHLHFQQMNPHIDWGGVPVEIPVAARPWLRGEKKRVAGVSSFGFSGTNAHVIVEEAPGQEERKREMERPVHLLALSARSETALRELTNRYAEEMGRRTEAELGDICYTANAGRAHFDERAVYLGATHEAMRQALLANPIASGTKTGDQEVAFLFSGQGAQYAGMGKELYETHPVFRRTLDHCAELLKDDLPEPLLEVLWGGATHLLEQTQYTQPALFALEYALAELWRSFGIEPAVVLGHSVGEYVAACVAGVYSLADGLKLIAARARLMQGVSGDGAMVAVMASEKRVRASLAGLEERVSIAALNAPENVVISGYEREISIAEERLRGAGVRVQRLAVSHGFHSPQMAEMETAFEKVAGGLHYNAPRVRLISSVTGQAIGLEEIGDPGYWRRQIRQPVRFNAAIETLKEGGSEVFVEVGPGATLAGLGQQSNGGNKRLWLTSLRKGRPEWGTMLEALAQLYASGVEVNWARFDEPYGRRRVALPTYPFERRRYWIESKAAIVAPRSDDADWERIREAGLRQSGQCRLELNVAQYPERWALLDKLTSAYICSVFHSCGVFQKAGERHSVESLIQHCGFSASYEKLLQRWLRKLVAEGRLRQDGETFIASEPLRGDAIQELRFAAEKVFLGDRIFLDYVVACGEDLVAILQGKKSSLETLFPGSEFTRAENLYERAPLSVYFNSIARAALEAFLRSRHTCALRILEIGAGTGSTASSLLPILPPEAAIYDFTDVSEVFVNHAERKFAAFPFVRYGLFDIERDGAAQGYPAGNFDVVVATNALHATRDIRATIANARSLLAPGGILILCEVTEYLPWFDITTGLIEGWQRFEDGLRNDHPLLETAVWTKCLEEGGFARVMAFPETGSPAEILGQHVFIAGTSSVGVDRREAIQSVIPAVRPAHEKLAADEDNAEVAAWLEAPAADRHEHFVALVRRQIAELLRFDSLERVQGKCHLIDLGLDSLMAIELRNRLAKLLHLQKPLTSTLVFDYPTPDAIASHLEREVLGLVEKPEPEQTLDSATVVRANELAQLDDEDVQALLLKKLQTL